MNATITLAHCFCSDNGPLNSSQMTYEFILTWHSIATPQKMFGEGKSEMVT